MALKRNRIIWDTIIALMPGLFTMVFVWGIGVLTNLLTLLIVALVYDLLVTKLKTNDFTNFPDNFLTSALSVLLITICLPPSVDFAVLLVACIAGLGLARDAYGGIGHNVFNPAMVGYAIVLISYPEQLAIWPETKGVPLDGYSGATLLTEFKYRDNMTVDEFNSVHLGTLRSALLISSAFFLGGLLLMARRIITWHIPLTIITCTALLSLWGYDNGSSQSNGSPWFHLINGGLIAAAFFVATDPVTHPLTLKNQLIFACLVACVIYTIRTFGNLPDGIAFAILLANCATPLLNRHHLKQGALQ